MPTIVNSPASTEQDETSQPSTSGLNQGPAPKVIIKTSDSAMKYELKHSWLYHSNAKGGLICKYCELFPTKTATGTQEQKSKWVDVGVQLSDHPVRQLDKHESSKHHQESLKKYTDANMSHLKKSRIPVYQQIIEAASNKEIAEKEKNRAVFKKFFKITYFVVRKYWAQTNFKDLVQLISSLGVEDLQKHIATASPDATYLSDKTISELICMISDNIEGKQLESLRQASFFTLLADESTDEQNREQLSIFMKWSASSHSTESHFMGNLKHQTIFIIILNIY